MNENMNELLSMLMDDEFDSQTDKLVDKLVNDKSTRDVWWRYHLISDALRTDTEIYCTDELAQKITAEIESEPIKFPSRSLASFTFLKPAAGLAIAASVAVIAILGVQNMQSNNGQLYTQPAQSVVQHLDLQPVNSQYSLPASATNDDPSQSEYKNAQVNARLNSYLVNYNEYHTNHTKMRGMMPYVRIIAHENNE